MKSQSSISVSLWLIAEVKRKLNPMLGVFEWVSTVRILWNLAKFYPELTQTEAPLVPIPAKWEEWAKAGQWEVEVRDHARFRATLPVGAQQRPAIVFSGGGGDDGKGYESLVRHWASHGLVVLQPVHFDSYNDHLQQTGSKFWAHQKTTWDVWALSLSEAWSWKSRCDDISRLLDEIGDLNGLIDRERIGAGGYSYGAHVACLLGGVRFRGRGGALRVRDRRIKAVLNLSNESGMLGQPKGVWKSLETPMLTITGERDKTVWGRNFRAKTEGFRHGTREDNELLILRAANHFALSGRLLESATHPADVAAQRAIFGWVLGASTLFWRERL